MSRTGGRSERKNVLLEEALEDEFFQIPPETFAVGGLVSLALAERTILFRSEKCEVMLDRLWAPYSRLVLDSIEDLVDGELE